MNSVNLIGRLTRDPEIRYTTDQLAVARFSVAIDRPTKSKSGEQETDFPNIVCFGRTAENVERFIKKGRQVGISGRLQTGSYEKDGIKVYTTEVIANNVEFLGAADSKEKPQEQGFTALNEDIPF